MKKSNLCNRRILGALTNNFFGLVHPLAILINRQAQSMSDFLTARYCLTLCFSMHITNTFGLSRPSCSAGGVCFPRAFTQDIPIVLAEADIKSAINILSIHLIM